MALLGSVVNGLAAFGVVLAITRGLGDADAAGAVFTTIAVFNIAFIVCSLGAEVAVVRAVARDDTNEAAIVRAALAPVVAMSCSVAGAMLIWRSEIGNAVAGSVGSVVADGLLVAAPFIPAASITSVLMATTRGRGSMMPTTLVERISRPGMQLVFLGAAGILGAGPRSTVAVWALSFGIAVVPAALWFRSGRPGSDDRPSAGAASSYWRFALPQAMTTVFQVVLRWADVILVAALADASTAAIYTAASRLLLAGNFLNLAVVQAISPMISNALARGERGEAEDLLRTGTAWLVLVAWPGYLLLIVFGDRFLGIFGDGYDTGGAALAILATAMLVASAVGPIEAVLLMGGGSKASLADNATAVGLNLSLNVLLVPAMGIEGAAVAWAVGLLTTNLAPLAQVRQRLDIDPFSRGLLRAAGTAVVVVFLPAVLVRWLVDPDLGVVLVIAAILAGAYLVVIGRSKEHLALDALGAAVKRRPAQRPSSTSPVAAKAGSPASRR